MVVTEPVYDHPKIFNNHYKNTKMKKFFVLFLLCLPLVAYSQKITSGSLNVLKNQAKVNLELDFSQAIIHGMNEDDFEIYERDWNRDKPQVIAYFTAEASDRCDKIAIGRFPDAEYTLKIIVLRINTSGDFTCAGELHNKSNEVVATITGISDKGGRIGSKLNLIKDGAKHTGERLGIFLRKKIK